METPSGQNMTTNGQSSTKKILLLMAGLGAVGAIVLIGLGFVLFFAQTAATPAAVEPAPTDTPTASPPPATPTVLAGVVVMASATPVPPTNTPPAQDTDTPGKPPTATRRPTGTPTPTTAPPRRQGVTVDGSVELIWPEPDSHVSPNQVEFRWRWLADKGCEQPPAGYAFEIRVWRDNDVSGPMGAMDAGLQKQNIGCDPASGIRTFTIGQISTVPGAEGQSSGRLRWDVALVQLEPYKPVITTQYRTFFY
jgi:hypothetical protein